MWWNKNPAFTLIELVTVIALVCIITTLVLLNSSFINRFAVRSEVEKLASTCRYLQQLAMSTNEEQRIVFDVKNNSYRCFLSSLDTAGEMVANRDVPIEKLAKNVQFGVGKRSILGPPSAPTKPIAKPITYLDDTITFYPDGTIQAGIVYFSDRAGSYVYAISSPVSRISFLRPYVYDGKWKLLK